MGGVAKINETLLPDEHSVHQINAPIGGILWGVGEDAVLEGFSKSTQNILDRDILTEEELNTLAQTHQNVYISQLTNDGKYAFIITNDSTFIYDRNGELIHKEALIRISEKNLKSLVSLENISQKELIGYCKIDY